MESNERKCSKKSKHGRAMLIAGSVITGLLATAFVVTSCGGHRDFRHDPEKMRKFAMWKVEDTLDDIDATKSQKQQILAIADKVVRDFQALHDDKEQDHEAVLAELERDRPDPQVFHELLDRRTAEFNKLGHATIDRALQAWKILDGNQRAELLEQIRDHIDDHR